VTKKEKEYWRLIEKDANKQCITCEFCFPEILDDDEKEEYYYDYSKCICASHEGIVEYGEKLNEEQLMSCPDCWSLSLDEYIKTAKRLEAKGVVGQP
jgi:hypothetical protein